MGACIKRYIESTSVTESFGEKSSFSAADIWINLGYVGNEGEQPHTYAWDIPISENHYLPDAFFRSVLFGKLLFCGTLTMSNCRFKSNGIIRKKSVRKRQICMYKNFSCFSRKNMFHGLTQRGIYWTTISYTYFRWMKSPITFEILIKNSKDDGVENSTN